MENLKYQSEAEDLAKHIKSFCCKIGAKYVTFYLSDNDVGFYGCDTYGYDKESKLFDVFIPREGFCE